MGLVDEFRQRAMPSGKKCSQCKDEAATGSAQMGSGKWVRVGPKCKRAMKIPKKGLPPRSETSVAPRHGTGEEKNPWPGGGKHRAHD